MIYDEIIRIFKLKRSSKIKKFDIFEMLVYDEQEEMIENKKVKDVNNELYDENLENFNNKLGEKYFFRLLILNILLAIMLFFTSMSNLALQVAYGGVV